MAKLINSHLILSGKLGDLVYCIAPSGKPYVRTKPSKQQERSPAQKLNSLKLTTVEGFLSPFRELIGLVWKEYNRKKDPYDFARSSFYKDCLITEAGDVKINFEEVSLSKGTLQPPLNPEVKLEGKALTITWETQRTRGDVDYSSVFLAIHNETTKTSMYEKSSSLLLERRLVTQIPDGFLSGTLHGYIFTLSPNGKNASKTQYLKIRD